MFQLNLEDKMLNSIKNTLKKIRKHQRYYIAQNSVE